MKKRLIAGALSLTLAASLLFAFSGCGAAGRTSDPEPGNTAQAADLMAAIRANTVSAGADLTGSDAGAVADFAARLFQNSFAPDKNTLISPLSVLCALGMTANGARGETLSQMEAVFGLSVPELNAYLHAWLQNLPSGDKYKVSAANSIWIRDDDSLKVEQDFLQTNADYYGAAACKEPFDDDTLKKINGWVEENTDGMIDGILDEIPPDAVMYLINALAFDAEWEDVYNENEVQDGTFTAESGEARDVEMMYSSVDRYLDDGSATGFLKYYADRKYAFAALLPNEGVNLEDYVASLTGDGLLDTLKSARDTKVDTAIPKFESEYGLEMNGVLRAMGMTDAFDGSLADLSGLGTVEGASLFISRVLHKTYIAVDERGTRAGAVTAVEVRATSAETEAPKTVYLDRPFVYMLIDCETNLPLFIGAVTDIG